jgi:FKBP-type peptidyl-prolyl cis-trans isomerase
MRLLFAFALATAFAAMPFAAAEDKKELKRPPVEAKEWKKQKSGLEIWDVKEGKGEEVKPGTTVTIHYTGWLTDDKATKFDSSVDRGEQATFPLGKLIKGWQEGIPGMKPGGVRRLKIPYELAYGEDGRPPVIPAKATLIFEIELFEAK